MPRKPHPAVKEMRERFQIGFSQDILFSGGIKVIIDEESGVTVGGPGGELECWDMGSIQGNPLECLAAILGTVQTGVGSAGVRATVVDREWVTEHRLGPDGGDELLVEMDVEDSLGDRRVVEECIEIPVGSQVSGATPYYGKKSSQQSLVVELSDDDADYDTQLEYADGEICFYGWNRYPYDEEDEEEDEEET